jgi:BirA family biotin operon repressor/biotin-[acetyl-CoA-carboxylase] ligase
MEQARSLLEGASAPSTLDGALLVADAQTSGRGRLQRTWWAPAGTSLLLSLILAPALHPTKAQQLTMICSLAVCDAILGLTGLEAQVKWPNDVIIGGRKVCGILTDLDVRGEELRWSIVGIGINVNVEWQEAPPLRSPATSLLEETGQPVSRLRLLVSLLSLLETRYLALLAGHSFHEEWAGQMATLGKQVQVLSEHEQYQGLAAGVDEDGALLLQEQGGQVRRILAGDVSLRASGHG